MRLTYFTGALPASLCPEVAQSYTPVSEETSEMLWIEALEIDDHILDKIESRHGVSFSEVQEVCASQHHARRGSGNLYRIFGQSEAGRYLLVVLAHRGQGLWQGLCVLAVGQDFPFVLSPEATRRRQCRLWRVARAWSKDEREIRS